MLTDGLDFLLGDCHIMVLVHCLHLSNYSTICFQKEFVSFTKLKVLVIFMNGVIYIGLWQGLCFSSD